MFRTAFEDIYRYHEQILKHFKKYPDPTQVQSTEGNKNFLALTLTRWIPIFLRLSRWHLRAQGL